MLLLAYFVQGHRRDVSARVPNLSRADSSFCPPFPPQEISLAAPVTITMQASVHSDLPSCSFFDEGAGRWDSSGLVVDSVAVLSEQATGAVEVGVSCVSFHLSDFSVTTTDVQPVFRPVSMVRDPGLTHVLPDKQHRLVEKAE